MTEANQRAAFLRAICEDPKDDTPRLMFADWLDEHGEPDRAEFIRVQLVLGGPCIFRGKPWPNSPPARCALPADCPKCANYDALRRRERELWCGTGKPLHHPCQWFEVPNWACLADIGLTRIEWTTEDDDEIVGDIRRGFVAVVTLPADVWIWYADVLTAACPLEEVRLTTLPHWRWSVHNADWPNQSIKNEPDILIAESALKKRWPRITFHLPEDRR